MELLGLAVWFLMLTPTLWGITAKHLFMKCEEDHECGENRFCYITGVCASCIDCSVYARKPHEWKSCAKSPTECGDCFDGYIADTLTEGEVRQFCIPLASVKNSGNKSGISEAVLPWYYAVLLVAFFTLTLVVIVVLYCKYRAALAARHQLLKSEQPATTELQNARPPPYYISGESPLLTRDTGGLHCRSDPAWQPDHLVTNNTTYQDKEHEMNLFVIEKTTDGVQQARPFEYRPEDIKECRAPSRTRSTCRPDEPLENYDKDDDNEGGLSVTHDSGINGNDNWNARPTERTEHETQETEETAVSKRKFIASDAGSTSSHHECDNSINLSCNSICSESLIDSVHEGSKEHLKYSSEKNILKVIPLTSKFDSGFISDSQVG